MTCERAPGDGVWEPIYNAREGVYQSQEPAPLLPPPAPAMARLRLGTPLRIKRDRHFLGARDLTAADLLHALYRRLRTLAQLQGGVPGGDPEWLDPRRVPREPDPLRLHTHWLRWHEWTRYSSRQDTLMQMGGLIGDIALDGPALPMVWPALWLGQWTHVGKGTAFGLRGYRIIKAERSNAANGDEQADRKLAKTD
ncbi:CRISPR system precrRNA processing endoribonuclease RAMP protein Cas6 [uncultured Thiodictyon sp.]|uniref:CRISPR system precrRNA processing endoribonuclease RAMP protein Cas6 n=1 Tax=uncultured Thiodictyon sp. TaxID=1846217 RepID=UPI0025D0A7AB|nr:CRISPR system precrRNA processing endoribonuclease RAMP protein Cas6 [uncultured Thiodictyon sp.]